MALRLGLGGQLFFGGEAEFDPSNLEADMLTTLGFFASVEAPLHRYFTLGGALGLSFWNVDDLDDADAGRSMLFDLVARPKARYPFVFDNGGLLELYAVLPIGVNLSILNDDVSPNDESAGVGFTVGFSAGVTYWLSTSLGLTGEFGFLSHSLSNEVEAEGGGESADVDISFAQWGFNLGVQFAL
jgi:hypothetical protein